MFSTKMESSTPRDRFRVLGETPLKLFLETSKEKCRLANRIQGGNPRLKPVRADVAQ